MEKQEKVIQIIADFLNLEAGEITLESNLKEDLKADSLDFTEIVMELEEEFDFEADEAKLIDMKTIGDVVAYVESI
jgi:acyl carrier protein